MMTPKTIRVLIVDDSDVARSILRTLLEDQADIEVVAEARSGREAIDLLQQLRPDLVTMDLNMPGMSGIAAIEHIMHHKAVPILVVSNESDAELAYEALRCGALEVMAKPTCEPEEAKRFQAQVRLLAGVPVITRLRRRITMPPVVEHALRPVPVASVASYQQVFVLALSTGGPQALACLLPQFEADFPAPILIAQHISDGFIEGMAQWLSGLCKLSVKVAEDGEYLQAGCVYLSPSEQHLTLGRDRRVKLKARAEGDIYHPSCDELLSSVATVFGSNAIAIIMTGMGRDGTRGMTAIHRHGGITLAQDEASSVIQRELPLGCLAKEMLRIVNLQSAGYRSALQRDAL
ncbi:MAG: chemotaxis-specific protein-glutamate methyltransferase CheB [Pseudomonas sp.]|nr:chemotaxis-specific protein-glutamate methyltransferase CheB [Pseudomonas sp.]